MIHIPSPGEEDAPVQRVVKPVVVQQEPIPVQQVPIPVTQVPIPEVINSNSSGTNPAS